MYEKSINVLKIEIYKPSRATVAIIDELQDGRKTDAISSDLRSDFIELTLTIRPLFQTRVLARASSV